VLCFVNLGVYSPFSPIWDRHGLPRKSTGLRSPLEFRKSTRRCRIELTLQTLRPEALRSSVLSHYNNLTTDRSPHFCHKFVELRSPPRRTPPHPAAPRRAPTEKILVSPHPQADVREPHTAHRLYAYIHLFIYA
jgi:hypothetical protein